MKSILKTFLPPILLESIILLRLVLFNNHASGLKSITFKRKKDCAFVLGNGPSLIEDVPILEENISLVDFICVNNFASSNLYKSLQPSTYVLIDNYFFDQDAHNDWKSIRENTFKAIQKDTKWEMRLYIPFNAKSADLEDIITNSNVQIEYFKCLGTGTGIFYKFSSFLYSTGFYGPEKSNVLLYAIYFGIWANYKEINIFGADMSFHNDISVNQLSNQLSMEFSHFNSESNYESLKNDTKKSIPAKMSDVLKGQYLSFLGHEALNNFANRKGIKIFNRSSYSLIDAYQRK